MCTPHQIRTVRAMAHEPTPGPADLEIDDRPRASGDLRGRGGIDARTQLRALLEPTTIPAELADALVREAPSLWLASDTTAVLGADLALCHPALGTDEVRARISTSSRGWRLTVVAHDRRGLLEGSARVLAGEGFSIAAASVASWDEHGLALHSISVAGPPPEPSVLRRIGEQLRSGRARPQAQAVAFVPDGAATVTRSGTANDDALITVRALDQAGLLWAVCNWLAEHDASIQAAWISGQAGSVTDVFVVRGDVDTSSLEAFLNGRPSGPLVGSRNSGASPLWDGG